MMVELDAAESAALAPAQARLEAKREAWAREKALLGRARSGDWAFAQRPPKRDEGAR